MRDALARQFAAIHQSVQCAHSHTEIMMMTDFLLGSPLKGAMVECGCYKGGSTAKLSIVAKTSGRRLFVFDSFQGLPEPTEQDRIHHWFGDKRELHYTKGEYAGSLGDVTKHVEQFGAIDVCEFVPGFFSDTLPHFGEPSLSFIFLDVDYISSARDCLRYLWPKLATGGRLYTHEACIEEFIYGITDCTWWHETLGHCPPLLIGAGYGCGPDASALGYMEKRN